MPHRLVNKADFERLLGAGHWARSAHFAVHHLPTSPARPVWRPAQGAVSELSTDPAPIVPPPVDSSPEGQWIGCVVPKRHAKRAVTRNLLKRQVRGAFDRHAAGLPAGLWLVRLRQPFAVADFPSARSAALASAVRSELDGLLSRPAR
jgi:ribonuclease P protein component